MAVALMKQAGTFNLSVTGVDKLLFKYEYDSQARLTTKTVPGAGKMCIVYDTLQRPVLLQDANLRTANKWNYIKYDGKGRAISQGIYTDGTHTTPSGMQAYVNGIDYSTYYAEQRSTSSTYGYYTNNVFPTSGIEPLAYSYYDDYHISNTNTPDYSYANQSLSGEGTADTLVNGMMTAVKRRTVGSGLTATWLMSVTFYDSRGRAIQTQSNNQLYATLADKATTVMDFTGKPTISKVVKNKSGSSSITVQTAYTYDSGDRVTAIDQSYNGGTAKRIANYQYNELGQLIKKNLGRLNSGTSYPYNVTLNSTISTTTNTVAQNQIKLTPNFKATATSAPLTFTAKIKTDYLQALDYRYTIRGQLLSLNNSTLTVDTLNNADANDVFGMEMLYNESDGGLDNTALYNGNLSAVKWRGKVGSQKSAVKSYVYAYNALDRLTDALYKEKGTSSWNVNVGAFDEKAITYDQSGNILTLKRNSLISGTVTKIDSLVYSYTGNRLNNVTDGTGSNYTANGYKNLAAYSGSTPYAYDENGNLVTDLKKGISNHYNILNRVDSIRVTAGTNKYIIYTYDAGGTLLRKQQYNNATIQLTTDYLDGFVFENDTLKYFATAEGRVRVNGSTFINEYVITDQQGNSRISFEDDGNGRALVRQENSYYPFGLIMSNGITPATQPNKKLYNGGSEWQNDYGDLPDYFSTFYRSYDQTLGRWIGVDPQPESAESLTPYQYAGNNPVMGNDPMGDVIDLQKEEFMQQEAERHAMQESQAQARMRASLQNEQDMMMQEGWNWMSEAYISMKQEAAAVATHTRQMAQLLGLVSADDFSADEYVRVQGTLLKEIKIKFGDPYSHRLGLLDLQEQVYNLVNPNEVNRDYVNASRKIAKGVDLAAPIYYVAEFYAGGELLEGAIALGRIGLTAYQIYRAEKAAAALKGGLNLFKFGTKEASANAGWKSGDYFLKMFDQGSPKLNWKQNSSFLRSAMREGNPIFDSYRLPSGELIPTKGFLNAERNLLQNQGWTYNPGTGAWHP